MQNIIPRTVLGKLSVGLIILMPVLFFSGGILANTVYSAVPAGNSIVEDFGLRPFLAVSMFAALTFGVAAFLLGLIAIIKQKERSPFVFVATFIGALLLLLLVGELIFPH